MTNQRGPSSSSSRTRRGDGNHADSSSTAPLSRAAVADALAAEDAVNATNAAVANTAAPRRTTRRLRHRAKPLTFQWKKDDDAFEYSEKKITSAAQLPNHEDLMRMMQKEQDVTRAFQAEMDPYKKYADPANVPSASGSRPACGRRSLALFNSGSATFQKVSSHFLNSSSCMCV